MTDDYNLAKPDPTSGHLPPEFPLDRSRAERDVWQENAILRAEIGKLRQDALNRALAEPLTITGDTSDGYHTFNELYAHRRALTAGMGVALQMSGLSGVRFWRSKAHHPEDGPMFDGSFIVGITLPWNGGTFTYHYGLEHWYYFRHAETLEHAPKWDGEGPDDTVRRVLSFATHD